MAAPPGIEDPISALFDLSDRAAGMAPVVQRLYRYTAAILAVWFVIMVILILVGLGSGGYLSILALGGLAAGVIALGLLRETDRFFRDFVQRHRWIRLLQDADPTAKVPAGRTPIERLGRYLAQSNPAIDGLLKNAPESLRYRVGSGPATGRSRSTSSSSAPGVRGGAGPVAGTPASRSWPARDPSPLPWTTCGIWRRTQPRRVARSGAGSAGRSCYARRGRGFRIRSTSTPSGIRSPSQAPGGPGRPSR